jgi:hypothetical protein
MTEPAIAFRVAEPEHPALEVRVNFGVLTGREVTPAEIDDLARALRRLAASFEIVAEQRHEFGGGLEASVHQVVIEMAADADAHDAVAIAEKWARACYDVRHVEI